MSAAEIMISTAIKFVLDPQGRVFQRKIKPPNTVQCDRAITGSSKMLISLHLGCVCPSVTLISFLADEFSIAAITNYRKFNGLKQDTFITAQLFRSEVRHNSHQAKIKVLTGLFFPFLYLYQCQRLLEKSLSWLFCSLRQIMCLGSYLLMLQRMTDRVSLLINCNMLVLGSRFCSVQDLRVTLEWIYFLSRGLQKLEGL